MTNDEMVQYKSHFSGNNPYHAHNNKIYEVGQFWKDKDGKICLIISVYARDDGNGHDAKVWQYHPQFADVGGLLFVDVQYLVELLNIVPTQCKVTFSKNDDKKVRGEKLFHELTHAQPKHPCHLYDQLKKLTDNAHYSLAPVSIIGVVETLRAVIVDDFITKKGLMGSPYSVVKK